MNEKAKPFIKWVGGKTQLLNDIDNALPKNILCKDDVTYIEPFNINSVYASRMVHLNADKFHLGVTLSGWSFCFNLSVRSSQKGFPLQSLTQLAA